jgi:histidine triad (HIT) family protein
MSESSCVFCRIIAGVEPAYICFANDDVVAFLDAGPATDGHVLVVPRVHCRNLLDASAEVAAAVMVGAQDVARLVVRSLGASGVTLFQANEPAGWQEVFHLHVHVVPRYPGDSLVPPWDHTRPHAEALAAVWSRLSE